MTTLREILKSSEFQDYLYSDIDECVAAIAELVEAAIGLDEPVARDYPHKDAYAAERNRVRAEIRNNLKQVGLWVFGMLLSQLGYLDLR